MYQQILVPVDLAHKDTARHTAAVAKSMAETGKSNLTILNVVPELPGYVAVQMPDGLVKRVRTDAEDELKQLAQDLGLDKDCSLQIRIGRPHNEILELADEIGADLIVITSHQPGIEDYLLGSVAAKVVRHAKCSVLVERQRQQKG